MCKLYPCFKIYGGGESTWQNISDRMQCSFCWLPEQLAHLHFKHESMPMWCDLNTKFWLLDVSGWLRNESMNDRLGWRTPHHTFRKKTSQHCQFHSSTGETHSTHFVTKHFCNFFSLKELTEGAVIEFYRIYIHLAGCRLDIEIFHTLYSVSYIYCSINPLKTNINLNDI
jgi:hypothetical protein